MKTDSINLINNRNGVLVIEANHFNDVVSEYYLRGFMHGINLRNTSEIKENEEKILTVNTGNTSAYLNRTNELINEVIDLQTNLSNSNWNGEDAMPLTLESMQTALKLIELLPDNIVKPYIVPTSEGGYGFEWIAPDKMLNLEIYNEEISWVFMDPLTKRKSSNMSDLTEVTFSMISLFLISDFFEK